MAVVLGAGAERGAEREAERGRGRQRRAPQFARSEVVRAADYGLERMRQLMEEQEPRLFQSGAWLGPGEPGHYVAAFNAQNDEVRRMAQFGYASVQATARLLEGLVEKREEGLESRGWREARFPRVSLRATALGRQCPLPAAAACPPGPQRYRSLDGRCNNHAHPLRGAAMTPLRRLLPPHYQDGLERPRAAASGGPLPSARAVSAAVHTARDVALSPVTHFLMQWGQFVDHDITASTQTRGFNASVPKCCTDNGRGALPPDLSHPDCLPIAVPRGDAFLGPRGVRCLEFVRSSAAPRPGCALGPRDQINRVTAYLDASAVYGSSDDDARRLRLGSGGLLRYRRMAGGRLPLLPSAHRGAAVQLCHGAHGSHGNYRGGKDGFHGGHHGIHDGVDFDEDDSGHASSHGSHFDHHGGHFDNHGGHVGDHGGHVGGHGGHFGDHGGHGSSPCFDAGDGRVNEQPGLIAAHALMMRMHNRAATRLAHLNPRWDDERVFQETRRIVAAALQHVTYREFLPVVLGAEVLRLFDLRLQKSGYFEGYDAGASAAATNAFAAAAFRFGHSLVQRSLLRCDRTHRPLPNNFSLHEELTKPDYMHHAGSVDELLLGMCSQPAQRRDEFITDELTNHLFQTPRLQWGMDLAALNIQRGRDHGLAPYNAWREACGLQPFTEWAQMLKVMSPETQRKLKAIYQDIDDIDLFPGGMAEKPVTGGLVGPTFACIIAQQFSNLRKGDRFWYENGGLESSFTPEQLQEIRKITLARILCDNLDSIDTIQPFVFLAADDKRNKYMPCDKIMNFDLTPWTEQPSLNEDEPSGYNSHHSSHTHHHEHHDSYNKPTDHHDSYHPTGHLDHNSQDHGQGYEPPSYIQPPEHAQKPSSHNYQKPSYSEAPSYNPPSHHYHKPSSQYPTYADTPTYGAPSTPKPNHYKPMDNYSVTYIYQFDIPSKPKPDPEPVYIKPTPTVNPTSSYTVIHVHQPLKPVDQYPQPDTHQDHGYQVHEHQSQDHHNHGHGGSYLPQTSHHSDDYKPTSSGYKPPVHSNHRPPGSYVSSHSTHSQYKPPSSNYRPHTDEFPQPISNTHSQKPTNTYGTPELPGNSYEAPTNSYRPKPPTDSYGPPKPPTNSYGPPKPSTSYGPPKPSNSYTSPKPSNSYTPPKPSNSYTPPKPPTSSYGPPKPPTDSYKPPSDSYQPPNPPTDSYKPPSDSYRPSKPTYTHNPPKPSYPSKPSYPGTATEVDFPKPEILIVNQKPHEVNFEDEQQPVYTSSGFQKPHSQSGYTVIEVKLNHTYPPSSSNFQHTQHSNQHEHGDYGEPYSHISKPKPSFSNPTLSSSYSFSGQKGGHHEKGSTTPLLSDTGRPSITKPITVASPGIHKHGHKGSPVYHFHGSPLKGHLNDRGNTKNNGPFVTFHTWETSPEMPVPGLGTDARTPRPPPNDDNERLNDKGINSDDMPSLPLDPESVRELPQPILEDEEEYEFEDEFFGRSLL